MIVGLTGPFGSGCSKVAQILSRDEFYVVRMSEILERDAIDNKGLELPTDRAARRRLLTMVAHDLRSSKPRDVLVTMGLMQASRKAKGRSVVLDSLKNHHEVLALSAIPDAFVIAIDASDDTRWGRLEDEYGGNSDRFKWDVEVDKAEGTDAGLNVRKCMELADVVIDNDYDLPDDEEDKGVRYFQSTVRDYVRILQKPSSREPTVPEIHMHQAYLARQKSKCLSRKVGAVVVRQKGPEDPTEFLTYGFNHAPYRAGECTDVNGECFRAKSRKEKLQDLVYCPRCRSELSAGFCLNQQCDYWLGRRDILQRVSPGNFLDLCRAVHAEDHAILRAVSMTGGYLDGCTLYATTYPCSLCAKSLVEVGINYVVYDEAYPMPEAELLLDGAGISRIRFEGIKGTGLEKAFPEWEGKGLNPQERGV